MISRKNRFHGHNSLNHTYRSGRVVHGGVMSLRSNPNSKRREYRVAVVVSKKVSKSAVKRNRIRRRVFETLRTESNIIKPFDIIITIFDESVAEIDQHKLSKILQELLLKSGILDKK